MADLHPRIAKGLEQLAMAAEAANDQTTGDPEVAALIADDIGTILVNTALRQPENETDQ